MILYDLKELIGKIDKDGILVQEVILCNGLIRLKPNHRGQLRYDSRDDEIIEYRTGDDIIKFRNEYNGVDEDWLIKRVVNNISTRKDDFYVECLEFRALIVTPSGRTVDVEEYFGEDKYEYDYATSYYNNKGKRFVIISSNDWGYFENTFLVDEDDDLDDEDDDLDEKLKLRENLRGDAWFFRNKGHEIYKYDDFPTLLFYTDEVIREVWGEEIADFYSNNGDYYEDEKGEEEYIYFADKYPTIDDFLTNEESLCDDFYFDFISDKCILDDDEYYELSLTLTRICDEIPYGDDVVYDNDNGLYMPHQICFDLDYIRNLEEESIDKLNKLVKELIIDKYPNMVQKKNVRESALSPKAKKVIKNKRIKPKLALESIYDDTPNKLTRRGRKSSTSEISSQEIENNEEVRTPETPFENGVAGLLNQAIVDEWTTIDEYNSILATISQNEEEVPEGLVAIIQDIIAEEYIHIGQLESLLQTISPNVIQIENGKLEAEEELDTEEELIFKDKVKRG